jgi:hypothetical protein
MKGVKMEIRSTGVSFGSRFLPNETLKSSFEYIKQGLIPSGNFVKSIDSLIHDGRTDIIQISSKQAQGKRPAIIAKVNDEELVSCGYNPNDVLDKIKSVRYCLIELAAKRNPKLAFENITAYEQKAISSVLEDLNEKITTKKINNIEKISQIIDDTKLKIQERLKSETAERLKFLETKIFG